MDEPIIEKNEQLQNELDNLCLCTHELERSDGEEQKKAARYSRRVALARVAKVARQIADECTDSVLLQLVGEIR